MAYRLYYFLDKGYPLLILEAKYYKVPVTAVLRYYILPYFKNDRHSDVISFLYYLRMLVCYGN